MKNLILTIQFLTRIPIPIAIEVEKDSFTKGIIYFPIVGALIGIINGGVYWAMSQIIDGILPIVSTVLCNILITGALHVDGLADTCDGIYSARSEDKMLDIMKDSRIGTNGAVAMIFDILFRIGILSALPPQMIFVALFISPVVSRSIMIFLITFSVYARENGLGGLYLNHKNTGRSVSGIVIGLFILFLILKLKGVMIFFICIIGALLYRQHIYSKIHGMTGDTLGAANEIMEILSMLGLYLIERIVI